MSWLQSIKGRVAEMGPAPVSEPPPPDPEPEPAPEAAPEEDALVRSLFARVFAAGLSLDGLLRLKADLEAGDPACRYYTAWSEPGAGRRHAAGLLREVLAEIKRRRET